MFRPIIIAVLLATSAPALSRVGPEIAYSTATEIYLVNPDGSGKVRLYRSKSNDFISSVALKPGGGTIAFVENWTLKFLDYDNSGRVVGAVRTIRPDCYRLADVHYHPDAQSVIYRDLCGGGGKVKQVAVPASATSTPVPTVHFEDSRIQDLGPLASDGRSVVYTIVTATQMELRRHYIDGTADPVDPLATASATQIRYPDISHDGARILFSDSAIAAAAWPGPGFTSEIDSTSGAPIRTNFISGRLARYAPGDTRIVFIAYNSYNDRYLRYLDEQNQVKQIGGRGVYWSVDWGD
jgi:hypothetical protein